MLPLLQETKSELAGNFHTFALHQSCTASAVGLIANLTTSKVPTNSTANADPCLPGSLIRELDPVVKVKHLQAEKQGGDT